MRVLFINFRDIKNPDAVGGDIYFWELAKGLAKRGHKIFILCSRFPGSKTEENFDGVQIVRVDGKWTLPLKIFQTYYKRFKGKIDLIVEEAIGGQRLPFFCLLYAKTNLTAVWHQRNTKIFHEQYAYPLAVILSSLEMLQAAFYRKQTIITPSKGARQQLLLLGFSQKNVKVVYDGLPAKFFEETYDTKRQNVFVWLGKIRRYKRPDHAILALAKIAASTNVSLKLVIAGKVNEFESKYVEELWDLAKKLGVSDKLEFKTNISDSEKIDLLKSAKVLVQPSPVEGFSIVVIEANAFRTPVVVSDGVPADVVVDGFNGFVYHFGDIQKFAELTQTLLTNENVWRKMSNNASVWARNFTWEKSIDVLNEILEQETKAQV